MTTRVRVWIAGVTIVAMAALISMSGRSYAGGEKDLKAAVTKIAALIKKGDNEGAKKLAAASAKHIEDMADLMHMFRPRNKGGMGAGPTPLTNPALDGIEVKLRELGRDAPPASVAKQAASLEEMGYYLAALGELSIAKGWPTDKGKKSKKAWGEFSEKMREAGVTFAKAAAAKGGQEIGKAAAKANANCTNCHNIFKD